MRAFVGVVCLLAWSSSAELLGLRNYHEQVGIPLAARIKEREARMGVSQEPHSVDQNRIIGGVLAPANAHPHFAGLLIDFVNTSNRSVCGSTLVSRTRLVTAAHCWLIGQYQARQFTVILGTPYLYSGGVRVITSNVTMHPQYNMTNLRNDIAVIKLSAPVVYSNNIQPVALPGSNDASQSFFNHWANAVGFGATSDETGAASILSHVDLQVISVEQCRAVYGSDWIVNSTLCTNGTGGVGVCGGDSGGPLTTWRNGRNTLIGVTSFAADKACEEGFPSGFARVTSFMSFILQHM